MDEKERLQLQGQIISEKNEEIEELKIIIEQLKEENELLKKDKTEIEHENVIWNNTLRSMILEYEELISDLRKIKKEISGSKKDYLRTYNKGKKELEKMLEKLS